MANVAQVGNSIMAGRAIYGSVVIEININTPTVYGTGQPINGFWNRSTALEDTGILLHELGHASNLLQGQVKGIAPNGGVGHSDKQQANQALIYNNCLHL